MADDRDYPYDLDVADCAAWEATVTAERRWRQVAGTLACSSTASATPREVVALRDYDLRLAEHPVSRMGIRCDHRPSGHVGDLRMLESDGLPGLFHEADRASLRGQRITLRFNRLRLVGAVLAAVGGALSLRLGTFDLWGVVSVIGFALALVAEVVLLVERPERDWYAGRALAESVKTLAWRYAVGAKPFGIELEESAARELLRARLVEVADQVQDRLAISSPVPGITAEMERLRSASFPKRRAAYVERRTGDQQRWYASRSAGNRARASRWRIFLIVSEVVALVLAAARAFGVFQIDLSGVLAALVSAGAAWVALKQYGELASAYAMAARELSLQGGRLAAIPEHQWADTAADAEEAISREHTMWLASRTSNVV